MKRFMAATAGTLSIFLCLATSAFAGLVATIPVGTAPEFVAVNQTTNFIYVSNLEGNSVSVINGATNTVVATVPVGNSPRCLDVNTTTNMIYVVNSGVDSVSVIDGSTNIVVATIGRLSNPYCVAVNSLTNQVFVSNLGANTVSVIDGASNTVTATVTVGSGPAGVRVNSTSNLAYVANNASGTISVIDGASDTVTNTFPLPSNAEPIFVALDPITNHLFVTDAGNEVVDVLDASSGALLHTISGGEVRFKHVFDVVMFQPGKTILISNFATAVMEVSESNYATIGGFQGGEATCGIAVNRVTGMIYVAELDAGTVNVYSSH